MKMKLSYLFTLLFFLYSYNSHATTIYVDSSATGSNNGISWANAYNDLQVAIDASNANDSIWVVMGTYYPIKDKTGDQFPIINRTKTFYINKNIKIYGGFTGIESSFSQRDVANNITILSGDLAIANNNADNAYNIVYIDGTSSSGNITNAMVLDGFTIQKANSLGISFPSGYGGGIHMDASVSLTACMPIITNNIFKNNVATYGAAIYSENKDTAGRGIISSNTFENNTADNGGAIYSQGNYVGLIGPIVSNNIFKNNTANFAGGSIYNNNKLLIKNNIFENNIADNGGAICARAAYDTFDIFNNIFSNNTANNDGGAIYNTNKLLISNNTFTNNSAGTNGGAIRNNFNGLFIATNNTFNNNFASGEGGAISNETPLSSNVLIDIWDNDFNNNSASSGAAIATYNVAATIDATIHSNNFNNNSATGGGSYSGGGAIYSATYQVTFSQGIYTQNIYNNIFSSNTSTARGGAIYTLQGGGITDSDIHNNLFDSNFSYWGGATYSYHGSTSFINNTFVNNSASNYGGAIVNDGANNNSTVFNCIFWNNGDVISNQNNATTTVNYCIFDDGTIDNIVTLPLGSAGSFNLDVYPLFIDTTAGDFRLQNCSPAVDVGYNTKWTETNLSTDMAGVARPQNGIVDLGAYESEISTINILTPFNGQQVACYGDSTATAIITSPTDSSGGYFTYQWGINTNNQTGDIATALAAGIYSVTATDFIAGCSHSHTITITEPAILTMSPDSIVPINCHNQATGEVYFNTNGGTPTYTYNINSLGLPSDTTGVFTSLPFGSYVVTITDINGCIDTTSFALFNPDTLIIDLDTTHVSCFGLSDGVVTPTTIGGTPFFPGVPYIYTWSTSQLGQTISNLAANNYTLTITDGVGCTVSATASVLEPTTINIQVDTLHYPTCSDSNGLLELFGTGGPSSFYNANNGAYAFSIDGGTTFVTGSTPITFSNLAHGVYNVVARDTNYPHCLAVQTIDLGTAMTGYITASAAVTCFDSPNGSATATILNPGAGVVYNWFSSANPSVSISSSSTATGLLGNLYDTGSNGSIDTAFHYILIATDADGCNYTDSIYMLRPEELIVTTIDNQNGTATTSVTGGTAPYTYLWSTNIGNQTTATVTGLGFSTIYWVTITDYKNCQIVDTVNTGVGVNQIKNLTTFDLFPNPNSGILNVDILFQKEQKSELIIRNILGQIILSQKFEEQIFRQQIDLNKYTSGVYSLSLVVEGQVLTKKITLIE
jgi:predicted outer membrane repeat protein